METQIQCPVCTLFLHAGMNLQDHLESHPKEKVIAALVNLTLFQQQSADECIEDYDCNQYETPSHLSETQVSSVPLALVRTIAPSVATRTYQQNNHAITSFDGPIPQHATAPAAHQVMIVDRTRVFHERSNVAINDDSSRRRILSNPVPSMSIAAPAKNRTVPAQSLQLITTNGLATHQQIQTLRPPPPYCVSVKENLMKQNASYFQKNYTSTRSSDSLGVELQRKEYQPLELVPEDHQTVNLNAMTAFETNEHRKASTQNNYNEDEEVQVVYEDGYNPDEDRKDVHANENTGEDLTTASDADTHQEIVAHTASTSLVAEPSTQEVIRSNFKIEKNMEKRSTGLQVISNVKVTPNTVLNISSLNSHIGDGVSMKDLFIIGTASTSNSSSQLVSRASTSHTSSHIHPRSHIASDVGDKNTSQNLTEVSEHEQYEKKNENEIW